MMRNHGLIAKDPNGDERLHQVATMGLVLFRIIAIYLKPVIPSIVSEIEKFFNEAPFCWNSTTLSLANRRVNRFVPLIRRVESGNIKAMVEEVKNEDDQPTLSGSNSGEGIVSIEDFSKVELRVGLVEEASHVDGADKLLKLHVDLGDEKRQIFAGIKQAYSPESLVGKLVVVVANLAPRKMRFGVSEGMVLAAGAGGNDVFLVEPSEGAEPGMLIK